MGESMIDLFDEVLKESLEERKAIMADSGVFDDAMALQSSETYRAECEARYCLNHPLADRREYLGLVEKQRGEAGRKHLEGAILKEWKKRKEAA